MRHIEIQLLGQIGDDAETLEPEHSSMAEVSTLTVPLFPRKSVRTRERRREVEVAEERASDQHFDLACGHATGRLFHCDKPT